MANFKKITDVEQTIETTKNTNILIDESGTLKKISLNKAINNSFNSTKIIHFWSSSTKCAELNSNTTYEELKESLENGFSILGFLTIYTTENLWIVDNFYISDNGDIIGIIYDNHKDNKYCSFIDFTSKNTIIYSKGGNSNLDSEE